MLRRSISSLIAITTLFFATSAAAAPYATDWVEGHNSRARLIVGSAPGSNGGTQRYAALELALPPGWKTYWRQPGSAGGIPPHLSWKGSQNLKSTSLKFPAPRRMTDPSGDTIGYKGSVIFPVEIELVDPARPVVLNLKSFFGVCRDICIPAQAAFKVTLPPAMFRQTPPPLANALRKLPSAASQSTGDAPKLLSAKSASSGADKHVLTFDVAFPSGQTGGADLFAETGDQLSLAMSQVIAQPNRVADKSRRTLRYQVTVDDPAMWQGLAKTGLVLTMVSDAGASEARIPRP